jgi:hypothetical protein
MVATVASGQRSGTSGSGRVRRQVLRPSLTCTIPRPGFRCSKAAAVRELLGFRAPALGLHKDPDLTPNAGIYWSAVPP